EFNFRSKLQAEAEASQEARMSAAMNALYESCQAKPLTISNTANLTEDVREALAGVLMSTDRGETWSAHGSLMHPSTSLIEGVLTELSGHRNHNHDMDGADAPDGATDAPDMHTHRNATLMMLFRTNVGCTYRSFSHDRGYNWTTAEPLDLINPNSKLDMLSLSSGHLAVAVNNHLRQMPYCMKCRTHLHVLMTEGNGRGQGAWKLVAQIDDEERDGIRSHYPSMLELDGKLMVFYSRFFLGRCGKQRLPRDPVCLGRDSSAQGIYMATVDMEPVIEGKYKVMRGKELPVKQVVPGFVRLEEKLKPTTNRIKNSHKWDLMADMIAEGYDLKNVGGMHNVRRHNLLGWMYKVLQATMVEEGVKMPDGTFVVNGNTGTH
ncbi:hypothetical protein CYMTET_29871, partial [Cymbomonas tetramitiformis]